MSISRKSSFSWLVVAGLFLLLTTTACSSDDTGGNQTQAGCEPGEVQTCTCDDGSPGERQCMDDETFTRCMCPDGNNGNHHDPDAGHDDADQPELNACGGEEELTYDGQPAEPDDPCGPCTDGVLECDGEEALTCEGASEPNSCGGCILLPFEPGDDCEDGTFWECDGIDAVTCRPCEENEHLVTIDGEEFCALICDQSSDCDDEQMCHETHNVCIDDEIDENACGGIDPLDEEPGASCADGAGEFDCDGDNAVVCVCDSADEFYDAAEGRCVMTDEVLCQTFCHIVYGCLSECGVAPSNISQIVDHCLNGSPTDPSDMGCLGTVTTDRESFEEFVFGDFDDPDSDELKDEPNTCADTKWIRCGLLGISALCGCQAPNNLGEICTESSQCDSGDLLVGMCVGDLDTDGELIDEGVCSASPCYVLNPMPVGSVYLDGGCGSGNGCMVVAQEGTSIDGSCVALCEGTSDCPGGTACQFTGDLYDFVDSSATPVGLARTCADPCQANTDCGDTGWRCSDEGSCQFSCDGIPNGWAFCADVGGTCVDHAGESFCDLG